MMNIPVLLNVNVQLKPGVKLAAYLPAEILRRQAGE